MDNNTVQAGSIIQPGTFRCEDCGYTVTVCAEKSMSACPCCGCKTWEAVAETE